MEKETTIIGYKGFNKNLQCRDFQYEVGKEYECKDPIKLCNSGFHFCENPQGVLGYYSAGNGNRFAIVEASGVSDGRGNDSKRVAKKLEVKAEISVFELCKIAVSVFFENFGFKNKIKSSDTANAGNYGAANAGDYGAANAGDYGAANAGDCGAANAGDCGAANAGDYGAAIASNNGKVKGGYGCILVARKIEWNREKGRNEVTDWACAIVDGVNIKEDTWYRLQEGKLVECK